MVVAVPAFKIAYMAVPKAACTSVKAALAHVDPDVVIPPEKDITVYTWHGIYPTRRFRPHRWEEYEGWWRFTVVRDPVKRLLSVYTNRIAQMNDLKNSRKLKDGRANLPVDPDPDYFFQNLEAYKQASSAIKHHALGAWLFTGRKPLKYDRVYRIEELGDLAADLSARTGAHVSFPRKNKSDMPLTLADLKPETIDSLRPFLTREYAHLSDYYQNPLS